jgi:N4-bis(aminopropyl)spermidine synthase
MAREIDLRKAINAISDVVQNRPRPLRNFDQIYMKTGDMVLQSELVARWSNNKSLAFIGDGDAISVCVAYLKHRGILEGGPSRIKVFDFDQRIVYAILRFADKERMSDVLTAELYNCVDAFPESQINTFDCFYTNPPWGASNAGESVKVFMQRGFEATGYRGEGMVVIADDQELVWPQVVLANTQRYALESGHYVQKMQSRLHVYHLDDAPDLHSCNLLFKAIPGEPHIADLASTALDSSRLANFYGKDQALRIRYVKEKVRVDYGKAHDDEYFIEQLDGGEQT